MSIVSIFTFDNLNSLGPSSGTLPKVLQPQTMSIAKLLPKRSSRRQHFARAKTLQISNTLISSFLSSSQLHTSDQKTAVASGNNFSGLLQGIKRTKEIIGMMVKRAPNHQGQAEESRFVMRTS